MSADGPESGEPQPATTPAHNSATAARIVTAVNVPAGHRAPTDQRLSRQMSPVITVANVHHAG
jgi:hypothetical protein